MPLTIYLIENKKTGHRYYNTTKSENPRFNPIPYFVKNTDGHYQKLKASVAEYGASNHSVRLIKCDYDDDKKQEIVYKKICDLLEAGTSLNDIAISPQKEECFGCGHKVRSYFMDVHIEKYCQTTTQESDLGDLLN